jgi:hypothetical protein
MSQSLGATAPFDVGVFSTNADLTNTVGFFLHYDQIPC